MTDNDSESYDMVDDFDDSGDDIVISGSTLDLSDDDSGSPRPSSFNMSAQLLSTVENITLRVQRGLGGVTNH